MPVGTGIVLLGFASTARLQSAVQEPCNLPADELSNFKNHAPLEQPSLTLIALDVERRGRMDRILQPSPKGAVPRTIVKFRALWHWQGYTLCIDAWKNGQTIDRIHLVCFHDTFKWIECSFFTKVFPLC